MIYETFIAPTERPTSSLDIKRALLTFDKVNIADPDDRDFFPPQAFIAAMGMPPIVGVNFGPVRPLGKTKDYDSCFDQLMSEIDVARRQGLIDVVPSYDRSTSKQVTFGGVFLGGYPLNPKFLLWAYRNFLRDGVALKLAIEGDAQLFAENEDAIRAIEVAGCAADGSIYDDPALPLLDGMFSRENLRGAYSNIGRARVAAVIKSIGFCASKNLVPFFGDARQGAIARLIAVRANDVIDKVAEIDPSWANRTEVLKVAHEEYIDDEVLKGMSIDDVLRLRTRVWGQQAEARDGLLRSASQIAREVAGTEAFSDAVRKRIVEYRNIANEVTKERSRLKFKVKCDVVATLAGVASGQTVSLGLLSQLQSAIGAATTLLAGCIYAATKAKEYGPVIENLKQAEMEFQDNAAFGLHNFYERIESASSG